MLYSQHGLGILYLLAEDTHHLHSDLVAVDTLCSVVGTHEAAVDILEAVVDNLAEEADKEQVKDHC